MSHVRAPASLPVSLRSTCGWLALLGAAIVGCSSDEPNGPEQTGTLLVTASTSGVSSDPDGYRLTLDGKATELLSASGQATFTAVSPGPHSVVIDDIATSCTFDWYAPRPVEVIAAETTSVAFELRFNDRSPLPIVFSSTRDNIYRDIYRADESFTTVERLTSFAALGDDQPSLSPGGTRIAFIRFPGTPSVGPTSQPQIWVMDADGSNAVLLVRDTTHVVATPAWSPDGTRIVFVRWSSGDERQIVITTADGREERVLYTGYMHDSTSAWDPRWSPDGSTVSVSTFVGSVIGIRLLNVESGQGHDIALPGDSRSVT